MPPSKGVEQKQAALRSEQDKAMALSQDEDELAAELGERQLSLNELNARVEEINAKNGRAIADNDASRSEYHDLLAQIHQTNEQLNAARQGATDSLEERRAQIDSLRARIKSQLDLLFH